MPEWLLDINASQLLCRGSFILDSIAILWCLSSFTEPAVILFVLINIYNMNTFKEAAENDKH